LLSLGGTIVGWSLVGAGAEWYDDYRHSTREELAPYAFWGGLAVTYLGPSFGHWYAGSILSRGMGARTAGLASMIVGIAKTDDDCDLGEGSCDRAAAAFFWTGLGLYAVGTIDDIIFAPRKARKHNLWMAPLATSRGGGFALGGQF
jgi:hypothetical protein